MADSEFTDDETEYDNSPSTRAVIMVNLTADLLTNPNPTNNPPGRGPRAVTRAGIQVRSTPIPKRITVHGRNDPPSRNLGNRLRNLLLQFHPHSRSRA
jgi:hypothetical protein